jgi:hypothetical protein
MEKKLLQCHQARFFAKATPVRRVGLNLALSTKHLLRLLWLLKLYMRTIKLLILMGSTHCWTKESRFIPNWSPDQYGGLLLNVSVDENRSHAIDVDE